jgi:hypothetical protein
MVTVACLRLVAGLRLVTRLSLVPHLCLVTGLDLIACLLLLGDSCLLCLALAGLIARPERQVGGDRGGGGLRRRRRASLLRLRRRSCQHGRQEHWDVLSSHCRVLQWNLVCPLVKMLRVARIVLTTTVYRPVSD